MFHTVCANCGRLILVGVFICECLIFRPGSPIRTGYPFDTVKNIQQVATSNTNIIATKVQQHINSRT